MKNSTLEPGILQIFRLFVAFRTVIFLLGLAASLVFEEFSPPFQLNSLFFVSLFNTVILLAYLLWRWPQRALGRFYFPLAILAVTAGSLFESYLLELTLEEAHFGIYFQPFVYLFMPLVLIAWQYNLLSVILFAVGTAAFEIFLRFTLPYIEMTLFLHMGLVFTRTVTFLFVGYMVNRLVNLQREQRKALAEANQALEKANIRLVQHAATIEQLSISQERNRMARELHDVVAHTLSGLAVQLDAVTSLWESIPPRAEEMLQQALKTIRSGLEETRRAVQNLRASPLEELGLGLAVRSLAEDTAERAGLLLDADIQDHLENMPPDVEQGFYRIAQEALENVARHALAARIQVFLRCEDQHLVLQIRDDGQGFDPLKPGGQGFGLQGMRERAKLMGARLEMVSQPGGGSTLRLEWEDEG